MPKYKFIEPEITSSDEGESDSDDSWTPGPPAPPDPNSPEQLRLKRQDNVWLITNSNIIPPMDIPGHMPYCIWYPGFATEDTYRALARQYPVLKYNVGRACAVGGYLDLYLELNLLPDVTIAEEARESGIINNLEGATAIFQHIMSQPVRYRVMDDYTRTVNMESPEAGAFLNGDTALRPPLAKDGYGAWIWEDYFDITEDYPYAFQERPWDPDCQENSNLPRAFVHLFYSPLPRDLPTARKDNLIVMAAYEGNVDRYDRLRRPVMVRFEAEAIIHGIYHSTTFAKYWCDKWSDAPDFRFNLAITARFIMINDLSRIPEEPDLEDRGDPQDLPHLIWHPLIPREETLRELVRRLPNQVYLRESVALACMAGNYQGTYDAIADQLRPDDVRLWQQAQKSPNRHYVEDLRRRAEAAGVAHELPDRYCNWYWQEGIDLFPTTTQLVPIEHCRGIVEEWGGGIPYSRWELEANAAPWELYIAASDEMRDRAEEVFPDELLQLYKELMSMSSWFAILPWKNEKGGESKAVAAKKVREEDRVEETEGGQEMEEEKKKKEDKKEEKGEEKGEEKEKKEEQKEEEEEVKREEKEGKGVERDDMNE